MKQKQVKQDRHHLFWPANQYKTGAWQQMRECDLFIPVMPYDIHHDQLHRELRPPYRVGEQYAVGALAVAQSMPDASPVEAIEAVQEYFAESGFKNIVEHLGKQLTYITIGGRDGRRR